MKLCSRLFVIIVEIVQKNKFRYLIPILRMARWKACVNSLLSVIELLFLSLTVEVLQGKTCQSSLLSEGEWLSWSQDFRGKGSSLGKFSGFYKTRYILLSDSANCIILRSVVLTQYRRMTDGQTDGWTDGIAVASTALAMACNASIAVAHCGRALRQRAVKMVDQFTT